jgi:hypothetical protein
MYFYLITIYFLGYIVCVNSCSAVHIITIYFVGNIVCVDSCSAVHVITLYFVGNIVCVLIVVQLFISSQYWLIMIRDLRTTSQYDKWTAIAVPNSRNVLQNWNLHVFPRLFKDNNSFLQNQDEFWKIKNFYSTTLYPLKL